MYNREIGGFLMFARCFGRGLRRMQLSALALSATLVVVGCSGEKDKPAAPDLPIEAPFLHGFTPWPNSEDHGLRDLRTGLPSRAELAEIVNAGQSGYSEAVVARVVAALTSVLPSNEATGRAVEAVRAPLTKNVGRMWEAYSHYHMAVESAFKSSAKRADVLSALERAIKGFLAETGPLIAAAQQQYLGLDELHSIEPATLGKYVFPILNQYSQ